MPAPITAMLARAGGSGEAPRVVPLSDPFIIDLPLRRVAPVRGQR